MNKVVIGGAIIIIFVCNCMTHIMITLIDNNIIYLSVFIIFFFLNLYWPVHVYELISLQLTTPNTLFLILSADHRCRRRCAGPWWLHRDWAAIRHVVAPFISRGCSGCCIKNVYCSTRPTESHATGNSNSADGIRDSAVGIGDYKCFRYRGIAWWV